jgi:hypothetical protein
MGAWLQSYWILPQSTLTKLYGTIPKQITQHDFYEHSCASAWWRGVTNPDKEVLSGILPPLKNWEDSVIWWGESDFDNRISITYTPTGSVGEFLVRVNCGDDYSSFVRQIVALAHEQRWAFVSASGNVLMPIYETISEDIRQSDAHRGFEPIRTVA